ncbi:MAG: ABC transporter ATP-binding protein [Paracoccaceae bacterium]
MLEIRNLSASYGQHRALDGASLRVDRGEIVVILGANGAGKSTLLKAISGICEGQITGSIMMNSQEIVGMQPDSIVEQGIALVPEGRGIFADLNVEENLRLGAYAPRARDDAADNQERAYRLFPKLQERRRQVVHTMSGGEQQMVAIGRAMMSNPAILTLDEPSLGLAPLLCKELFQNLKTVRDIGIGILLVEQNARASLAIADRGYLLENAHIIQEDSAENLARDPAVQKAYLGGSAKQKTGTPMVQSTPRPPSGPPPSDIAALAMQSFAPTSVEPIPSPKQASVATQPEPAIPVPPLQTGMTNSIEIDALVARATEISARSTDQTPMSRRSSSPARVRSVTRLPDLTSHGDRLQAMLQEIESAAVNARRRTPNSGRNGRKPT